MTPEMTATIRVLRAALTPAAIAALVAEMFQRQVSEADVRAVIATKKAKAVLYRIACRCT